MNHHQQEDAFVVKTNTTDHSNEIPSRGNHLLSVARRNVLRNPRSYLAFILALLAIQTLLCLTLSAAAADVRNTQREITENYDYDIMLRGISQPQYAALCNLDREIPEELRHDLPYTSLQYEALENGGYNVYIALRGEDVEIEGEILRMGWLNGVAAAGDGLQINYSPRYNYAAYLGELYVQTAIVTILLLVLSVFLLVMLQKTRLNHEKYQYGIYMTFGAGFPRLFDTAAGELMVIVLLTTPPSLLLGSLVTCLLCLGAGGQWMPSIVALVLPPILTALATWISVYFPVKALSRQTPVELLTAGDNSNLVTSPKRSLRVFGRSFPFTYELFSLWRYRRYLAGLLLCSALFGSLWLGLVRVADYQTAKDATPVPEYTIDVGELSSTSILLGLSVEELAVSIEEIDGVAYCEYQQARPIMELRGFMAVTSAAAKRAGSYTVPSREVTGAEYPRATNAVRYVAYNEAAIRRLYERCQYIEGDAYAVLTDDRSVILSTALNNTTRFSFAPGDTVLLAVNKKTAFTEVMTTNNLDLLRMMLADEDFYLQEYTVCAVIHDEKSDDLLTCGLNFDSYLSLAEQSPYATTVDVYLEEDVDFATLKEVDAAVQREADDFFESDVIPYNTTFSRNLGSFRNLSARIVIAAYLLLAMMPLFSFFSQRVFYGKREREWFVLKTLGASRRQRSRLVLLSGAVLTAVNFAVMLPLGLLADYAAFKLCNEWLPAGGFMRSALMHYAVSPLVIPVLLLFAVLCGFVPCALEYRRVREQMQREDRIQALLAQERAQYIDRAKEGEHHVSEKNTPGA